MYNLISASALDCKNDIWQQNRKYHTITGDDFNKLALHTKDIAILDIRSIAEYNNESKDSWKNTGHIKNAINIAGDDLANKLNDIAGFKNKPVVIYSFSSHLDAYKAAATLISDGFTNVNILAGGIFDLRWKAANIKNKSFLKDWITNIPSSNL